MEKLRKLFRIRELENVVGIKQTKIYKGITEGTFPEPIRIGVKVVAWDSEEIDEWIEKQIQNTKKIAPYKWNGAGNVGKKISRVQSLDIQGGKL